MRYEAFQDADCKKLPLRVCMVGWLNELSSSNCAKAEPRKIGLEWSKDLCAVHGFCVQVMCVDVSAVASHWRLKFNLSNVLIFL